MEFVQNSLWIPKLNEPAIKASVLDRFRDIGGSEGGFAFEVRDGPGDLQGPGMGAGGENEPVDRHFDELPRLLVDRAGDAELAVGHAGVEGGHVAGETRFLDVASFSILALMTAEDSPVSRAVRSR